MLEIELRQWAIEQVVKHHGQTGISMDSLMAEAEKLLAWVKARAAA